MERRWECPEIGVSCRRKINLCVVIASNKAERRYSRGVPVHCISLCIVSADGETGRLTTTFVEIVLRNVESLDEWSHVVNIYFSDVEPRRYIIGLGNGGKSECRQPLGTNTIHCPHVRDRLLLDHWIFIQSLFILVIRILYTTT
jgi:hypothetical protein